MQSTPDAVHRETLMYAGNRAEIARLEHVVARLDLDNAIRHYIQDLGGSEVSAAELSGLSRPTVRKIIGK